MDQQQQQQRQPPPKAMAAAATDHNKTEESAAIAPTPNPKQKPDPIPSGEGNNWANILMGSEPEKTETAAQPQIKTQLVNSTNSSEPSPASTATKKPVQRSPELVTESPTANIHDYENTLPPIDGSNPYIAHTPAPASNSFSFKDAVGNVKDVLGRWGKKVGEATKKAEDLAGNTWQHLKTSPSFTDAAMGRIAQGTKVLAEGGYEKIFQQTFETVPEEQLLNSFACYLSTSAGPVMGILYVSTAKLAFCSDNPLSYNSGGQTEWSYYKVVIPLHQLRAVNPSSSTNNPAEKYVQVISIDNHEFWLMGFLNYSGAMECLQEALEARSAESV